MNYKYYSVCAIKICAYTLLPWSYDLFEVKEPFNNDQVDVIIRQISKLPEDRLIKVAELSYAVIWKMPFSDGGYKWLFESRNGLGGAVVSADYSEVEVYYPAVLLGMSQSVLRELASPYIRLALECKMIQRSIISLHASCVEIGENGFAFTGPSGIGKSTRCHKWCELFSAHWVSGDRPAIDTRKGYVYGVPWDGKEAVYRSVKCPLSAILVVRRSELTGLVDLSEKDKQQILTQQSFCPLWDVNLIASYFYSLKQMIQRIPIYELCSDNTSDSMYNAYMIVQKKISQER